ncbi:FMN-binding negative transcriptional regulator [Ferroplasma sp.]|uniref:FMN-binding negative transcriptional regulator n=1 Tax=Ferroplasma sp. TaxID=2591003 RepID=UPI00307D0340
MYIPREFKIDDMKKILDFIDKNNFGMLLSIYKDEIYNTQIPLLLDNSENNLTLKGHMARANMQWYHAKNKNVAVLFTGPHHYISPLWYKDRDSVPTWDYMTVRLDGILEIMNSEETQEFLLELSKFYDQKWAVQGNDKRDYYAKMVLQIVAFRIKINKITCKYKLSQNRPEDMENIIINLQNIGDEDARLIAHYMKGEIRK